MSHARTRYIPMAYFDSLAEARRTLRENSLLSLEFQTELIDWMARPVSLDSYASFMRVYGYERIEDDAARRTLGEYLHNTVKSVVANATTYYVSPDMCELVTLATGTMPASGLLPTDLPTDTGFLLYDRPRSLMSELPVTMDDGTVIMTEVETRVAGFAWQAGSVRKAPVVNEHGQAPGWTNNGELTQGVSYYLFCTPHDMAVQLNQTQAQVGEEPVNEEMDVRQVHGPLPIYDFSGWAYNMPWFTTSDETRGYSMVEGEQEPMAGVHSLVDQGRRLILATWRILNQENIVVLDPNRPPRHMRRRAERVGVYDPDDITIIRMRKEVYQGLQKAAERDPDDTEPWYTCRFWVQGHWHNYWMGPKGSQHLVPKFVPPYQKGPEGAPLKSGHKIISLEE